MHESYIGGSKFKHMFSKQLRAPRNMSDTGVDDSTSYLCDRCQHVLLTISGQHVDMPTEQLRCPLGCL